VSIDGFGVDSDVQVVVSFVCGEEGTRRIEATYQVEVARLDGRIAEVTFDADASLAVQTAETYRRAVLARYLLGFLENPRPLGRRLVSASPRLPMSRRRSRRRPSRTSRRARRR